VAGTYDIDNDFRRDLDEMARIVGLKTIVTLHVDADRQVVRAVTGDHHAYYREGVAFSREAYSAPPPGDADVVLVNAYPADGSLTFTRSKGMAPLHMARGGASRVLISACTEGLGYHGLFPFMNGPRFEKQIHILRRLSVIRPTSVPRKLARRGLQILRRPKKADPASGPRVVSPPRPSRQIWLHRPGLHPVALPSEIPGMVDLGSWTSVLRTIEREQGSGRLSVVVYPCSPLHCIDIAGAEVGDYLAGSAVEAG
jgi:hypothetical protein